MVVRDALTPEQPRQHRRAPARVLLRELTQPRAERNVTTVERELPRHAAMEPSQRHALARSRRSLPRL